MRARAASTSDDPLSPSDVAPLLGPTLFLARTGATGVVLAVSGGPDSVALMRLAAELRSAEPCVPLLVATVDHGLRPASGDEAEAVSGWADACGLPHRTLVWVGDKPRTGVQAAARAARYGLLAALARETRASHLLTGHTLDDQAETVVMRLARGTGIGGLAGMRPEVERHGIMLARPFLALPKARLVATCRARGWPFLDDPSNADPRFARARLRDGVMPVLAREGLTAERLAALAERARRAEDALDARAAAVLAALRLAGPEGRLDLDGKGLRAEPDEILLRVVARAVAAVAGAPVRDLRLERVERCAGEVRDALDRGERLRATLGGGLVKVAPDGRLTVAPEPPRSRGRRPPGGRA